MAAKRKLVLYIACSLDGYIAAPGDDLSFLSRVQKPDEDYGYYDFIKTVDTVIVGRRTYDWVVGQGYAFPHADKECYILTRTPKPAEGSVQFYTDPIELVMRLKEKDGKNIFLDGGAEVVNMFLKKKLIDEFYISVIPVLLGDGVRLFRQDRPHQLLKLVNSKTFDTGLVQLHYILNDGEDE